MNINATLIVQALNFCIAYFLFRFILLKPAYTLICERNRAKITIEKKVATAESDVADAQKRREAQWRACRKKCIKHAPERINRIALFRGIAPKGMDAKSDTTHKEAVEQTAQSLINVIGAHNATD